MSKLKLPTGEDFPEAARKHLEDAKALYIYNRFDGAGYLIGYCYECILKTFLELHSKTPYIHDLNELSSRAIMLATLVKGKTAKYQTSFRFNNLKYDSSRNYNPSSWKEGLRYFPEGMHDEAKLDKWITDAENFYNLSINRMKLDGIV